jgi:hypothetical protein
MSVQFRAANTATIAANTVTWNLPAGLTTGDIIVATWMRCACTATNVPTAFTSAGYTNVSGSDTDFVVAVKLAAGGETAVSAAVTGVTGVAGAGVVLAFSGAVSVATNSLIAFTLSPSGSSTRSPNSYSATKQRGMRVWAQGWNVLPAAANATVSNPSGYTSGGEQTASSGAGKDAATRQFYRPITNSGSQTMSSITCSLDAGGSAFECRIAEVYLYPGQIESGGMFFGSNF